MSFHRSRVARSTAYRKPSRVGSTGAAAYVLAYSQRPSAIHPCGRKGGVLTLSASIPATAPSSCSAVPCIPMPVRAHLLTIAAHRCNRPGNNASTHHLIDLCCSRALQIPRQQAPVPPAAPPALSGPAALNAIGEAALREHVLAVLQQPPGNEPYTRAPRIAPYITNDVLLRVADGACGGAREGGQDGRGATEGGGAG